MNASNGGGIDDLGNVWSAACFDLEKWDINNLEENNVVQYDRGGDDLLSPVLAVLVLKREPPANNIYLSPKYSSASYGSNMTVEVYADTTALFQGGQFYLKYDGCAKITDITFNKTWHYTTKDMVTYPGAVFATFRKDPPMVSGTQHIATLTIQCDNPEYCKEDLHFAIESEVPLARTASSSMTRALLLQILHGMTAHSPVLICQTW